MMEYPQTEYEWKEARDRLKAAEWMIEMLRLNPPCVDLAEDPEVKDCGEWEPRPDGSPPVRLGEYDGVFTFAFYLRREGEECPQCHGHGWNEETRRLEDRFYSYRPAFARVEGEGWHDQITQDEVDALVAEGRLHALTHRWNGTEWESTGYRPTAEEVNAIQRASRWDIVPLGDGRQITPPFALAQHDAINRLILTRVRAERLGIFGYCPHCEEGTVYHDPVAELRLLLWVVRGRKARVRLLDMGVPQEQVGSILSFLRAAAEHNTQRFAAVLAHSEKEESA